MNRLTSSLLKTNITRINTLSSYRCLSTVSTDADKLLNDLSKLTIQPKEAHENKVEATSTVSETKVTTSTERKITSLSQLGESDKLTDAERLSLKRDPLLSLFVNLVMKNGEKSKAEKIVNKTLFLIRQRTLSDPYLVLTSAVEKASPLMKTKSSKVGSKTVQVPRAISQRKRNRIGINWILTAAMKRKNRSASEKFANELIAIMNGESSVLAKKLELHKLILANRSNAILGR